MLTRKAKYALGALKTLAESGKAGPVLIADLSAKARIPRKFLERILLDLKTHGFLRSRKGKGGGYYLGRLSTQISVGDVIRVMDGPLAPVPCVSQSAYARCTECQDEATCGLRLVMKEARDALANILDGTSLADLVQRSQSAARARGDLLNYEI